MRDKNLNNYTFISEINSKCQFLVQQQEERLRRAVVANSNFLSEDEYFFRIKNLKKSEFIRLAILSWYCSPEVRCMLQTDLNQKINDFNNVDQIMLKQLLVSKEFMHLFLIETNLWHSKDFWGNVLNSKNTSLKELRLPLRAYLRKKAQNPQRKRGYNDKGSRAPSHAGDRNRYIRMTKEINERLLEVESHQDTLNLIFGMLM